ncbi:MAG: hypothetical protein NXI31_11595 [bacterium]|nr:hypothetical protein [bacterium]
MNRAIVTVLLLLNLIVLLGQIWPEGAPPFARWVNIAFLVGNAAFLLALVRGRNAGSNQKPGTTPR